MAANRYRLLSMRRRTRVIQFGCGPIGCRVAAAAAARETLEVVGAIDVSPTKVGRDLGELAGLPQPLGVRVSSDLASLCREQQPDVVLHTTGSYLEAVAPQLRSILAQKIDVVSTCEELSYPFRRFPDLARELDSLAREHGVTLVGTGINPGFLMDAWPAFMSGVCNRVDTVAVTRIQDASSRRAPFQRKIGAGLSATEFQAKVDAGEFGHVGLEESVHHLAAALGWEVERLEQNITPVLLQRVVASAIIEVPVGMVAGLKQEARAYRAGSQAPCVTLDFQAYLGADSSYDEVVITGDPPLRTRIEGGTPGDISTAAVVVNTALRVGQARPGLLPVRVLPLISCA